ncbi:MAG: hypothetical protein FWG70_07610 [Oscillospiraceae bacterium]|nr:hypothetical protein [Oscillospiraceae bacterium]
MSRSVVRVCLAQCAITPQQCRVRCPHRTAISRCFVFFRRDVDITPYKTGLTFRGGWGKMGADGFFINRRDLVGLNTRFHSHSTVAGGLFVTS